MIEVYVLFALALVWIIFAVFQDLRTREIANWLNFSLVIFALGFRFFYSLFSETGFSFFYQGLFGFGFFVLLGNIFYYGKMFAGGDAKLMMALGAILPFSSDLIYNLKVVFFFLILFLMVGALYGLFFSLYLTLKNLKRFKKEFLIQFKNKKRLIIFTSFFASFLLILNIFYGGFIALALFVFIFPYFYLYVKSVDEACMVRRIKSAKLTVGDWLYEDVKIANKVIKANWDGLLEKDIELLKKKKKFVLVRYGIQFAPVFLISFILWIIFIELNLVNFFMEFF